MVDEAMRRLLIACQQEYSDVGNEKDGIKDYEGGGMGISIVNLARAFDYPALLPYAFYRCCKIPVETPTRGADLGDGTFERLSPEDLAICIKGREDFAARPLAWFPFTALGMWLDAPIGPMSFERLPRTFHLK